MFRKKKETLGSFFYHLYSCEMSKLYFVVTDKHNYRKLGGENGK